MESSEKVFSIGELKGIIDPLVKDHRMTGAALFGSYARGEAQPESDIDVILKGAEGFKAFDVFAVAEAIHRATGKQVDVFELSELEPGAFKDTVMREMVAL